MQIDENLRRSSEKLEKGGGIREKRLWKRERRDGGRG
jgi:hypothetical protein